MAQGSVDPVAVIADSIQSCIDPIAEWCAAAAANPNNVMHDCPVSSMESTLVAQNDLITFLDGIISTINGTIVNETAAFGDYTSNYNSIFEEFGSMADEACKQNIIDCYGPEIERDSYVQCINSTSSDLISVSDDLLDELDSLKENCKKARVCLIRKCLKKYLLIFVTIQS